MKCRLITRGNRAGGSSALRRVGAQGTLIATLAVVVHAAAYSPRASAHCYESPNSPSNWPGAACPSGQVRKWRIGGTQGSGPWLSNTEVIAASKAQCDSNRGPPHYWPHGRYGTGFGATGTSATQNTQYETSIDNPAYTTGSYTYQTYGSQCQGCGPGEYADPVTNACQPKPGCAEGEQLTYCPNNEPRNDKQLGPNCPTSQGNPINSATGNKYQRESDYRAPSGGLTFIRSYNSRSRQADVLGASWRHNWQSRLVRYDFQGASYVVATRADGQSFYFTLSNGNWINEADIQARLIETAEGFVLTDGPTQRETYDAQGRLLQVETAGVDKFTLTHVAGVLTGINDRFGRSLTLAYDALGRLQTLTDPADNVTSYAYDAAGNLASVTYPGGQARTYHYENASYPHALTGITDENGDRYATWTYDSQGRAESGEHAGGADANALAYNADGTTTITNAFGVSRTRSYQLLQGTFKPSASTAPGQQCGENFAATGYDANGFVGSRTDFNGNVTTYVHNTRGLEESRTEAYGTSLARTITTQWHASFRVPMQIDEPGRRTTYTYDAAGNRLTQTVTDTDTSESRTTTWTYNTDGQVLSIDGSRTDVADVTTYTYFSDSTANHRQGDLHTITNAAGHVTEITAYDKHGNPLTIVDANGVATTLTYDVRQRLKTRTVAGATTTFDYDGVGQLDKVTLPDGSFIDYTYDAAHRLTDLEDNFGNRIHYTLDLLGNRTKEEVFDPSNTPKRVRSQVFDTLGRLDQIKNAAGQIVTDFGYDAQGNRTSQTDFSDVATGFTTTYLPDALNRIKKVTDAASGETHYGYNPLDQLEAVTDPKSLTTFYTLNALGDLKQQVSPDTGTTSHNYDAAGNRKTQTDARGVQVVYSYDVLNRLTFVDYPGTVEDITYSYDDASQPYGKGRLTGITDQTGATTLVYDARGNVTQEQRLIDGATYTTSYGYDGADRVKSVTYPTGRLVTYERDASGYVSKVTTTVDGVTTTLADDVSNLPFGGISGYTLGNGVAVMRGFDQDYRLKQIKDQGTATDPVQHLSLTYDLRRNVDTLKDEVTSVIQDFGYDELSRLTSVAGGTYGARNFTYDGVGNRLTETADTYIYPSNSHRLSSQSSGVSYGYDEVGNVTYKGDLTLAYNQANRLSSATVGGTTVTSVYSASGQRAKKTVGGTTTLFHYDRQGRLLAEQIDSGLLLKREYVWLEDIPLAQLIHRTIPEFIVDNGTAGFSTVGAWATASGAGQYGANYAKRSPATELAGQMVVDDVDLAASYTGLWVAQPYHVIEEVDDGVECEPSPAGDYDCWDDTATDALVRLYQTLEESNVGSGDQGESPSFHRSVGPNPVTGAPAVFRWQVALPGAGRYRVYARWGTTNDSGPATYRITHGGGTAERSVDQRVWSNGWSSLGSYEFGTDAVVTLTPSAGYAAVADAVRFVPIEDTDDDLARWAATGEAGTYEVLARWPAVAGASSAAPFTIEDDAGTTRLARDQTSDAGQWNSLGNFTFSDSASQGVELRAVWDKAVLADAIRFLPAPEFADRHRVAYYHVDHLSTPQKMTDGAQNVVWEAAYGPFGEATITSQPFYDNPLRFPGQYFDAETGLHQNWHRDYDPSLGRYLQSDPMGLWGGLSTYGYGYQNPLSFIDPTGLQVPPPPAAPALPGAGAMAPPPAAGAPGGAVKIGPNTPWLYNDPPAWPDDVPKPIDPSDMVCMVGQPDPIPPMAPDPNRPCEMLYARWVKNCQKMSGAAYNACIAWAVVKYAACRAVTPSRLDMGDGF